MLSGHGCLDDGLLYGAAVWLCRLGTKGGKAEPAAEFFARVVSLSAPSAGGVEAGSAPQATRRPAAGNWRRTQGGAKGVPLSGSGARSALVSKNDGAGLGGQYLDVMSSVMLHVITQR